MSRPDQRFMPPPLRGPSRSQNGMMVVVGLLCLAVGGLGGALSISLFHKPAGQDYVTMPEMMEILRAERDASRAAFEAMAAAQSLSAGSPVMSATPADPVQSITAIVSRAATDGFVNDIGAALPGTDQDPMTSPVSTEAACIRELETLVAEAVIYYDTNQVAPDPGELDDLRAMAEILKDCDQVMIEVEGHSDAVGDETENLLISWKRAENLVQLLRSEGYDVAGFKAVGLGSRALKDDSGTVEAARANRRVEFNIEPRG